MKALIAMSGGVDSSVAAKLTQDAGYTCIGCTMKLHENEAVGVSDSRSCCTLDDAQDARSVAYRLHMPFYVFNFTQDFRSCVIDGFVQSYCAGCTPNPCIDCNRYLKFDRLYERAKILDCDCIVTGHYARIEQKADGSYVLKKALDASKDQSYVLYNLTQQQLAHTRFPLGELKKAQTREIAAACGFVSADKPDSQDICFVPDGDYAAAITRLTGKAPVPGNFVDLQGNVIGQHRGIIHYTIGQRRGLQLPASQPLYVCQIIPQTNTVVLGPNSAVFRRTLTAGDFNWISGSAPEKPIYCRAKVRYRQPEQPAWATALPDGRVKIEFDEPQRAITPGQAAVLYDGDVVLGGGRIEASTPAETEKFG